MADASEALDRMVDEQVVARGVRDTAVVAAMRRVPRTAFIADELREFAYDDGPLPIGADQTISQPFIVAFMIQALELRPEDRVLEVGSGSGYAAAVMSRVCRRVYAVERHPELVEAASRALAELGYKNVETRHGDGTLGWPEAAPFDAILVSAGGPALPDALRDQLADGGRLVIPIGDERHFQRLVRVTRQGHDSFREEDFGPVSFVPLIGAEGWHETD